MRFVGEYRPPRELVSISAARVVGPGHLGVGPEGLEIDGRMMTAPLVPRAALSILALVGVLASALVPSFNEVAMVATLGIAALGGWLYWRSEFGVRTTRRVPWTAVEHVVRLQSDPDVVAVVLEEPVGGLGTPESVYFAATLGAPALADALAEHAPGSVSLDLDSGVHGVE